jgi:DNA-binding transcriptional MerR regulator
MPVLAPVTITGLSQMSGIDADLIRTYRNAGLLPKPRRHKSRVADAAHRRALVERLTFIWRAQKLGFPLDSIGQLLGLDGGLRTCADVYRIAVRYLEEVKTRATSEEVSRLETALMPLLDASPQRGWAGDSPIIAMLSHSP